MHQQRLLEVSAPQATQDGASRWSRLSSGSGRHPPTGALVWAWLLLGALMLPGAWSFLSEEQEELLVELHNHYRGLVSPGAAAMMPLWDPDLKLLAEGYAAKCVWNHNPELEDTGENLFAGTGPLDLREALEKWFLERLDYDFHNNSCDEDKMCGHYTQMVWADTHRVGCAFHLCHSMESLDWERVSFLVCNYYPAGNYEGERPYVEGDWCSRCPENLQKCENNLCVADVEVEEEDEEEVTVVPPPATSDPSPTSLREGPAAVSSASAPSAPSAPITTAKSKPTTQDSRDDEAPATPALSSPSGVAPTAEDPPQTGLKKDEVEEKEKEEKTPKSQNKQGLPQIIFQNKAIPSSGSVFSSSLLVAGLTGVVTLRL